MRLISTIGLVAASAVLLASGASAFGIDLDHPPPPGVVGMPYTFKFVLKAGAPPYEVHLGSGDLTPGLKIESDGTMHGTPTQPGTFDFTVEASQYCAPDPKCYTQWGFTQKVRDKLNLTTPSLTSATVGTPYSATLTVVGTGGLGMGWRIVSGSLPPGLTMVDGLPSGTPGGQTSISGTPTATGTYTFTVKVGDHRRLHARPLDDEAVHAGSRRATRGRTGRNAPQGHRRPTYQRDAGDGDWGPRPLHVERRGRHDSARAGTQSRIGRSRRLAHGGGLLLVLAQCLRCRRAYGDRRCLDDRC